MQLIYVILPRKHHIRQDISQDSWILLSTRDTTRLEAKKCYSSYFLVRFGNITTNRIIIVIIRYSSKLLRSIKLTCRCGLAAAATAIYSTRGPATIITQLSRTKLALELQQNMLDARNSEKFESSFQ